MDQSESELRGKLRGLAAASLILPLFSMPAYRDRDTEMMLAAARRRQEKWRMTHPEPTQHLWKPLRVDVKVAKEPMTPEEIRREQAEFAQWQRKRAEGLSELDHATGFWDRRKIRKKYMGMGISLPDR